MCKMPQTNTIGVFTWCILSTMIWLATLTATLALLGRAVSAASGTCSDMSYTMPGGICKNNVFAFNACIPDDKTPLQFQAQIETVASAFISSGWDVFGMDMCKSVDIQETCAVVEKTPRTDYCSAGGGFCGMTLAGAFATLSCMTGEKTCTPKTDIGLLHTQLMCCDSNEAVIRSMCGTPAIVMDYTAGVDEMVKLYACAETDCFSIPISVGEGGSTIIGTSSAARVSCALGALGALGALAAAVMLA